MSDVSLGILSTQTPHMQGTSLTMHVSEKAHPRGPGVTKKQKVGYRACSQLASFPDTGETGSKDTASFSPLL